MDGARILAFRDLALETYSPLGTGGHLADPMVGAIAQRKWWSG